MVSTVQVQAGTSAVLTSAYWSGPIVGTTTNYSGSHQETRADFSYGGGEYLMRARAFSVDGVVGALGNLQIYTATNLSGGLSGVARASWSDSIQLVLPERFQYLNPDHLSLRYNIGATGSTTSTSVNESLAYGSAAIDYTLQVGGTTVYGTQYRSSSGASTQTGTWGTVSGTVTMAPGDSLGLYLQGGATADIVNGSTHGIRQVTSTADFGSTLIWNGIVGVNAFAANGAEIVLPADFQVDLIGSQSGFNYWNAAVHPNSASVPEGGVVLPVAVGAWLAMIAFRHRGALRRGRTDQISAERCL